MIILDFGSGETCRNDWPTAKRMIDELAAVDSRRHNVVIKWQLFTKVLLPPEVVHSGQSGGATELLALDHWIFDRARAYALDKCYFTTASVFDARSVEFLRRFHLPFVKFATRPDLYWMMRFFENMPIVVSMPDPRETQNGMIPLCSVREYPANAIDYEHRFGRNLALGISDHTAGFDLWHKWQPRFYETHFRLFDSIGLDAGPWAKTPSMLKEVLG